MLCAHDSSPRPLTEKIIERPRLMERIRTRLSIRRRAYLTVFNSTPLERKLAVLLGIPLNGLDPRLQYLGTKSGSRKVFREAGVEIPMGVEDVKTEADVAEALLELRRRQPGVRHAVIKLNDSFSGEGNAVCTVPPAPQKEEVPRALQSLEFAVPTETPEVTSRSSRPWAESSRSFWKGRIKRHQAPNCARVPTGKCCSFPLTTKSSVDLPTRRTLAAASPPEVAIVGGFRSLRCGSAGSSLSAAL